MAPNDIPSELRTGLSTMAEIDDPLARALIAAGPHKLVAIVTAIVTRAASTAAQYAEHSGRAADELDVVMALRYRCRMASMDLTVLENDTVLLERSGILEETLGELGYESVEDLIESCRNPVSEPSGSDEDDDDWSESSDTTDPMPDTECPRPAVCSCQECLDIREANDTWAAWEPTDPFDIYFKAKTDGAVAQVMAMSASR